MLDRDEARAIALRFLEPGEELRWYSPPSRWIKGPGLLHMGMAIVFALLIVTVAMTVVGYSWGQYFQEIGRDGFVTGLTVVLLSGSLLGAAIQRFNTRRQRPPVPLSVLEKRVYAITDRRLLVIDEPHVRSFTRAEVGRPYFRRRRNGPGDVLFDGESGQEYQELMEGVQNEGAIRSGAIFDVVRASFLRSDHGEGFWAIDDAAAVRRLIEQWLDEDPPGDRSPDDPGAA